MVRTYQDGPPERESSTARSESDPGLESDRGSRDVRTQLEALAEPFPGLRVKVSIMKAIRAMLYGVDSFPLPLPPSLLTLPSEALCPW